MGRSGMTAKIPFADEGWYAFSHRVLLAPIPGILALSSPSWREAFSHSLPVSNLPFEKLPEEQFPFCIHPKSMLTFLRLPVKMPVL
jgi:hypothetical protein